MNLKAYTQTRILHTSYIHTSRVGWLKSRFKLIIIIFFFLIKISDWKQYFLIFLSKLRTNQSCLDSIYCSLFWNSLLSLSTLSKCPFSLCQRLGLTRSERNKPWVRSATIERRRRESPPEAKDERSESFAGGARSFVKQNRVFEHTHLPLCRPGVSIQRNHYQKMN